MNCEQALVKYLQENLEAVKNRNDYWPIPNIDGFSRSNESGYEANVALKKFLNVKWSSAAPEQKYYLANVIVSKWGGIHGNKKKTLTKYISRIADDNPATPYYGMASYSKIFSIVNLNKYAIYDARVAVSLNAIQYTASVKNGVAFNYIPGRNNTTGNSDKKTGFAYMKPFTKSALIKSGWRKIKRDETYPSYLHLMRGCLREFPNHKLYDLEMVLFANAEDICRKAARKAGIII